MVIKLFMLNSNKHHIFTCLKMLKFALNVKISIINAISEKYHYFSISAF